MMENVRDLYKTSPVHYSSVSGRSRGRPSNRGKRYTTPESSRSQQVGGSVLDDTLRTERYREEPLPEYQDEYHETPKLYPSIEATREIDELYTYMQVLDSKIESMSAMLKDMHGWLLSMKVNQSVPTGAPVAQNMSSVGRIVKSTQ
jgi:hypothetical protein